MSGTRVGLHFLLVAAALSPAALCRADLFAAIPAEGQILRINSASGAIVDAYEIPIWLPPVSPSAMGMAFDGRWLSINVGSAGLQELWQFDVVDEYWLPGGFIDTTAVPAGPPRSIAGFGYLPNGIGGANLIGVTLRNAAVAPSYIFQFGPLPGFPNSVLPVGPPVELPANLSALGADVDPATGELWIGVDEIIEGVNVPRLVRADYTGAILQTLTPSGSASPIRGVGFDDGAMFIGVRNLPRQSNEIYEVDRTTGAVLRTITLQPEMRIAALAGGPVIPEPSAGMLLAVSAACALARRRARSW